VKKVLGGVGAKLTSTGIAVALLSLPMQASADRFWLRDDGNNGIRFGTGRLHSSIEVESRYDSFAGWGQTAAVDGPEKVGDLVLHVKPALRLDVPAKTLRLGADAGIDYVGYTGSVESWTSKQSKLNANLGLNAVLNPEGDYQVEIDERFVRSDRTTNLELGVLTISNRNDVGLAFDMTPGGGAWVVRPSYTNTIETFEPRDGGSCEPGQLCSPANLDTVNAWNYMEHRAGLDLGWKLGSKSVLVLDTGFGVRNYSEAVSEKYDAQSLRVVAGYVGMVAPKIELKVKAGYGAQFASDAAFEDKAFSGMLGQAEASYLYTEKTKVSLGYLHTFSPSPTTSLHYTNDRGYLGGQWAFSREFGARATLAYDTLNFSDDRRDEIFSLTFGPEYQPNDMLAMGVTYGFMDRTSNTQLPHYEYDRNEFGAYVVVRY
jgi:hypothetical protein